MGLGRDRHPDRYQHGLRLLWRHFVICLITAKAAGLWACRFLCRLTKKANLSENTRSDKICEGDVCLYGD